MYGLKQAALLAYQTLSKILKKLVMHQFLQPFAYGSTIQTLLFLVYALTTLV